MASNAAVATAATVAAVATVATVAAVAAVATVAAAAFVAVAASAAVAIAAGSSGYNYITPTTNLTTTATKYNYHSQQEEQNLYIATTATPN